MADRDLSRYRIMASYDLNCNKCIDHIYDSVPIYSHLKEGGSKIITSTWPYNIALGAASKQPRVH